MNKKYVMIGAVIIAAALIVGGAYFLLDTRESEDIEYAGTILEDGAKLGLMVPDYTKEKLGLESISDLNDHVDTFEGKIIGIDPGAGIMEMTKKAITEYGLDFELVSSSEAGMISNLKSAYDKEEPIVVTLWDPQWAVDEYDMVYLEDEKLIYGEAETIESWTRGGLLESDETFAKLIGQFSFGNDVDTFNGLLSYVENFDGDVGKATKEWLSDNEELKNQWIEGIEYEDDRGHINIGYVNWACATATSNILKHVLEDLGYTASLKSYDAGPMFTGLAYGDLDVITTVWAPLTHQHYLDDYAGPGWKYEVIFDLDYETDDEDLKMDNLRVNSYSKLDLSKHTPEDREGYTFKGWEYEGGEVPDIMPREDITVTAVWETV